MTDTSLPPAYLFKKEPMVIPADNPWAYDKLGRKAIAAKLSGILESIRQPMVMSLSSRYGMGKSTFIDCWRQELSNEGIKSIKFNAWETDFSGDAFSAFISAFQDEFKTESKAEAKLKSISKKVGLSLLKSTPSLLARIAVKKATGESIDEFLKSMETDDDELSGVFGDAVTAMFEGHTGATKAVEAFKSDFEGFIKDECGGKLIVFIDELDRCKPKYAVEVLESIKHLFSVKGAIFIIGIDRVQLLNSISGVYGVNLDSEGYIRKFIDWDFKLPEPSYSGFISYLCNDIFDFDSLYPFAPNSDFNRGKQTFISVFSQVAATFQISLREVEQICTQLFLILNDNHSESYDIIPIICVLLIRHKYPDEYKDMINEKMVNVYNDSKLQRFIELVYEHYENHGGRNGQNKLAAFFILRACSQLSESTSKARIPVNAQLAQNISTQAFGENQPTKLMQYIVSESYWDNSNASTAIQASLQTTLKLPTI